jgi:hypothetical protein
MVSRPEIMLAFWQDDESARRNLRDLLSKLRSELPEPELIKTDRDWIWLDLESVYVDVIEFEELYKQLTLPFLSVENRPLPEVIYQKLISAINIWESPQFLAGTLTLESEGLDEWLDKEARLLNNQRLDLIFRLCQHLIYSGDLENALAWLDQLINEDGDYEFPQAVYAKIDALYRLQRYAQADEYGQHIVEEMGIEWFAGSGRQLKLLLEQISTVRKREPTVTASPQKINRSKQIPFTGQSNPLFQIQKAYQRGGVLAISGEAGIGKTRLAQVFLESLSGSIRTLRMEAHKLEKNLPYHTIIDLLRKEMNKSDWQTLEPFWGQQFIAVMPELNQLWPSASSLYGLSDNKKINLLEAFHQLFLKLAKQQKLILILDNAQWCDEETLSIFTFLIQRDFFTSNNFLLLLMRKHEVDGLLTNLMVEQPRLESFSTLEVPPLTNDDINQIAFSILGKKISHKQLMKIRDACGGNALFVIEALRAIIEIDAASDDWENSDIPLPGTVHAIIRDRLKYLQEIEKEVLFTASVIRPKFSYQHLQDALIMDALQLAEILEKLEQAGLIAVETPAYNKNIYKFRQQFVMQVCKMEIGASKYQLIHLRIARALQTQLENGSTKGLISQAAYHFAEAGEAITAFNYWIRVASSAHNTTDSISSYEAYRNAQQIIFHQSFELTIEQMFRLFIGWGSEALIRGDLEVANDCFTKATIEGQRRNDDLLLGSGYSGMAYLFLIRGLPGPAMQYINQAIKLINKDYLDEFIRARTRKAMIYIQQTLVTEAIEELIALDSVHPVIKTRQGRMAFVESRYYLALCYIVTGAYAQANDIAQSAIQILKTDTDSRFQAAIDLILGMTAFKRGRYAESLKQFGDILQAAEFQITQRYTLQAIAFSSASNIQMGNIYRCLEHVNNGFQLSEVYNSAEIQSTLLNSQGKIYLYFENYKIAIKLFKQASLLCTNNYQRLTHQQDIGLAQCLMGNYDSGSYTLREVIQSARLYGLKSQELEAKIRLALMTSLNDNRQENLTEIRQLTQQAQHLDLAGAGSALWYLEALQAIELNQPEMVQNAIDQFYDLAKKEESIWWQWHAVALQIKLARLQNISTQEYENLNTALINRIKQSLSKELLKDIQLNSAPIAILG